MAFWAGEEEVAGAGDLGSTAPRTDDEQRPEAPSRLMDSPPCAVLALTLALSPRCTPSGIWHPGNILLIPAPTRPGTIYTVLEKVPCPGWAVEKVVDSGCQESVNSVTFRCNSVTF